MKVENFNDFFETYKKIRDAHLDMNSEAMEELEELEDSGFLLHAAYTIYECGNQDINFDMYWGDFTKREIPMIEKYGIERFTISAQSTGVLELIANLMDLGWYVTGHTKVNYTSVNVHRYGPPKYPALVFEKKH